MTDIINFKNFLNNAIGFERFFEDFNMLPEINTGFPHYNIMKVGKDKYVLEMALAGYKKSDINVSVMHNVLSINGKASDDKEEFVHKGIAKRSFRRQLQLSEYVNVLGSKLEDGMLKVELKYNFPDREEPVKIAVK